MMKLITEVSKWPSTDFLETTDL